MHKTRTIGQKLKPQQRESHGRLLQSVHFFFLAAYVSLVYTHLLLPSLSKERYTNGLLIRSDSSIDTFYVCVWATEPVVHSVMDYSLQGENAGRLYSLVGIQCKWRLSICACICVRCQRRLKVLTLFPCVCVCVQYTCAGLGRRYHRAAARTKKKANKKKIKKK